MQAREGFNIGLAVTVRYRLDPSEARRHSSELAAARRRTSRRPVVSSTYRQLAPNYETREIFAVKREELRTKAADAIKTAPRRRTESSSAKFCCATFSFPPNTPKGLEGLLLKEQENERLTTEQEIKGKEVRIAELEAEAQKARDVKQAESQAQVRVLQAKAESDAMQYTLPLKQKQIEQTKLEAASAQGSHAAECRSRRAGQNHR